jgi:hypothetical protein
MPRFVILEHDHPHLHWDLMLEAGEVLQTWRLAQPPEEPACVIEAEALGDHRQMYLDYEGPVSGNRGTVRRWDVGSYTIEPDSSADVRNLSFEGTRLRGRVFLERLDANRWRFRWLSP